MRRFFGAIGGAYMDGWRVARALPWLFAAIIGAEFVQHIVEWQLNMFVSEESARAAGPHPLRLSFGWVKMAAVFAGGFIAIRYLVLDDANAALRPPGAALRAYGGVLLYLAGFTALILHGSAALLAAGVPRETVTGMVQFLGLGQLLLEPLLLLWFVSAATGGGIGPFCSVRTTGLLYLWALPVALLGKIPVNALHGTLNMLAVGKPAELLWPMLVLDSLVVGALVAIFAGVHVRIASEIARRRRVSFSGVPAAAAPPAGAVLAPAHPAAAVSSAIPRRP